jgi:hypothetical protein
VKGDEEAVHPHSNGVFGPWRQSEDGSVGYSRSEKRSVWKPSRIFGVGKGMGKGSSANWVAPYSMNMRSFSAATGDIRLGPQVVCYNYWGKACRSVPPMNPGQVKVEGRS